MRYQLAERITIHFMSTKQHAIYIISAMAIVICAWFLQNQFLLHWDVSWDILVTKRLLAGGSYANDFFDLNPPAIFFIYSPAIWIAQKLNYSTINAFRLYIFILMSGCMILNYKLLLRIFAQSQSFVRYLFFVSLTMVIFILPDAQLGEREHIFFVLTVPYFLSTALNLHNQKNSLINSLLIGLLAFLGFAIKPYFLCPFLLIEGFCMVKQRCWLYWVRTEVLTILCLLVLYAFTVLLYYPDYLFSVVPLAIKYYSAGFYMPLTALLNNANIYFMAIIIVWYFSACYIDTNFSNLTTILFFGWIGCFAIYILQHTVWRYHLYPAFAISILLGTLLSLDYFKRFPKHTFALLGLVCYLMIIPVMDTVIDYKSALIYKKNTNPLVDFLQHNMYRKSVYFISTNPREVFPAVQYADTPYVSRLLHFFWIPHVVKTHYHLGQAEKPEIYPIEAGENQFIRMVAEDINLNKPQYIFIDTKPLKGFLGGLTFEYLPYLLHNTNFKNAWTSYHFETSISHGIFYQYAIYKRTEPTVALSPLFMIK